LHFLLAYTARFRFHLAVAVLIYGVQTTGTDINLHANKPTTDGLSRRSPSGGVGAMQGC